MRILIAEPDGFPADALEADALGSDVVFCAPGRDALLRALPEADALWVRLAHRITADLFDHAPKLRWIVSPTTGLNHIDLEEAERRGVTVLSLKGKIDFLKEIRATAEHTVGLMLALLRHTPAAHADVLAGHWRRDMFQGSELHEKTIGLFGYGRLGTIVARYLHAFDARVLVTDPRIESMAPEQVLQQADIVSLHVDLTPETQRFFGAAQFASMKPGAFFVNTSRGELVDEAALLTALEGGHVRGAALDVLANESSSGMGDHPLVEYARSHGNLLLTPHIGGCTAESMQKTERFMAQQLLEALRQEHAR
jgi:D-3-phosphoglycerate dehydrogenase